MNVIIPGRFRGPPDSANGGYACGVLGCRLHGAARVRLNSPPPLDTPLELHMADGRVTLLADAAPIGEAVSSDDAPQPPATVSFDDALHASRGYRWYEGHPFATCFVCGPERDEGDGLRIFPGRVAGSDVVAAPWVPHFSVCDEEGRVRCEVVWAALDCPSWFGILEFGGQVRYALLGQLTARIHRRPSAGSQLSVIGWNAGRDGRKLHGGAAIMDEAGELLASSAAVWVELKDAPVVP